MIESHSDHTCRSSVGSIFERLNDSVVGVSDSVLYAAAAYWSVGPAYCYVIGGASLLIPLLLLTRVKRLSA